MKKKVVFRKQTLLAVLFFACSVSMWGVKVDPTPTLITQADGTQLVVIGHGDCHTHWYTTVDGVLLYHQGTSYYVAAVDEEGQLMPTTQLAHEVSHRATAEKALIAQQHKERFFDALDKKENDRALMAFGRHNEPVKDNSTYFPHTGSPRVLVLLVQFQDEHFIDEDPVPVFEEYFNATGSLKKDVGNGTVSINYGSVRQYFNEMSFGAFTPQFDIYGPVTLSQPLSYYGHDSGSSHDQLGNLLRESFELADSIGVDFTQYDQNNDDLIDLFYVVYAGYGQCFKGNSSDCIWPQSGTHSTGLRFKGKSIYRYGVNNEINGTKGSSREQQYGMPLINGIGLFCHEFSHTMGLPDFYPTNKQAQDSGNPAMEYWDLMDGGEFTQNGNYPTEYTAWEREAFGWMEIETLNEDGDYQMLPLGLSGAKAYRLVNENDPSGREYLFLQNIQARRFNRALGLRLGHGMLATHVDYDPIAFSIESNSVNNVIGHSRMTVLAADGQCLSSYLVDDVNITAEMYMAEHGGDPYPGTSSVTEIANIPFYNGSSAQAIRNIAEDEQSGTVSFSYIKSTDAIRDIPQTDQRSDDGIIRDLSGRVVGHTRYGFHRKGIYIVGNKKQMIR